MQPMSPGWYRDPAVAGRYRWWDGQAWTSWLAASDDVPAPPTPERRVIPAKHWHDRLGPRVWIAAGIVAALLTVFTIHGVQVDRAQPPEPTPPSSAPAGTSMPNLSYTDMQCAQQVRFGDRAVASLPGAPFGGARTADLTVTAFPRSLCFTTVPNTKDFEEAPNVAVAVGVVPDGLIIEEERTWQVGVLATRAVKAFYGDSSKPTFDEPVTREVVAYGADHPAAEATVTVHYSNGGKEYTGTLYVLAVRVSPQSWVMWAESAPQAKYATYEKQFIEGRRSVRFVHS